MPPYQRILAIINPAAGQFKSEKIYRIVDQFFKQHGLDADIKETEQAGDALKWTRAARAEGYDLVTVAGGDGTIREACEGLMRSRSQIPLAQVPTGTGNVTARALRIPTDARKALDLIVKGKVQRFDVGYLPDHDRYFTFVAGAGYDARLIHDTTRELKKTLGFFAYVASGAKHFFKLRPVKVTLEIDNQIRHLKAHTVMAINIGSIANLQWAFAPNIDPHDGKLNIVVMSSRSWLGSFIVLFKIITKRYYGFSALEHMEGRRIRVEAEPPLPIQIDGEALDTTPFLVEVIPNALPIVVPIDYQ
ncbi:MAG: diacylglycerol kinase family lipid kinase [Candidatus Krumholzibacteria bacterium]|nr:diacylglycerol kinase family lipid kinase [Candidatus Krumholzibacteria bacterium]